jgi:hypothetical protein
MNRHIFLHWVTCIVLWHDMQLIYATQLGQIHVRARSESGTVFCTCYVDGCFTMADL